MKNANPYLTFQGNTEEAFDFYQSVFGGEFATKVRFKDFGGMGMPEADQNKIAHVSLPLGTSLLMGSDAPASMPMTFGTNFSVSIEADSADEASKLFDALAAGGKTGMPMDETEWAEKFGMCTDKFGVAWMVGYTGNAQFGG